MYINIQIFLSFFLLSFKKKSFILFYLKNTYLFIWSRGGGHEEWLIIYFQFGRRLGIAQASKVFYKQDFQDLKRSSYC